MSLKDYNNEEPDEINRSQEDLPESNDKQSFEEASIELDAFYNGYYWIIIHPCSYAIIETIHANYTNKGYIAKCITVECLY